MKHLIKVSEKKDILAEYINTPIGFLLEYHNLGTKHDVYHKAQVLIGLCMDSRIQLKIPQNFAYFIRSGGCNLRGKEFLISYTVSVGEIAAIALVTHSDCGMVDIASKKIQFVQGLVERAGWDEATAEKHFNYFAPLYEIENEIEFVVSEAERLCLKYPKMLVVPLFYNLEDSLLYLISR